MARLWSSGAELNSATSGVEIQTTTAALTIDTITVRSGSYSFKDSPSFNGSAINQQIYGGDTAGKIYFRIYARYSVLPSALTNFIIITNNSTNEGLIVRLNSSNQLILLDISNGNTQIGSSSAVLSADQWYRVEVLCDAKSGSKTLELYIDGVLVASGSALSLSGIKNLTVGGFTGYTAYYDDLAINDDTGSFQNSYPGAGQIIHLKPNSSGDNNSFSTQVGGTAGSSNNYTRVNEVTPDDATSYNADTVTNNVDDFNIDNTSASIGSGDTINVVQVGVRYSALVASLESSLKVRAKKASGGTVSKSAAITPTSTSWVTNANSTPFNHPLTLYQDPDSSNWTKATLDTAQIGYEISSGNTNGSSVSDIWLLVDSTPAATTTSSSSSSSSTSSTSSSTSSTSSSSSTSSTSSSTSSTSSSSSTSSTSSSTSSTSSSSSTSSTSSSSSTSSTSSSHSTSSTSSSTSSTSSSISTSSTSTSTTSSSSTSTTLPPATTSSSSSSTSTSTSTSTTTILFHPKIDILQSLLHGRPSGEFS